MAKGVVYVMSTIIPGLIKIGKTQDFEERMSKLESDGYKNCTGLKREFAIEVDDCDTTEKTIHMAFEAHQVGNTELYALNKDKVIKLLMGLNGEVIYPTTMTKREIEENADEGVASSELQNGNYTYEVKSQLDKKTYKGLLNVENGILTLKAGSTLAELTVDGSDSWIVIRKNMGLKPCTLSTDLTCSSVSIAANFVCGHQKNGWKAWKDSSGNYIDIYRKK